MINFAELDRVLAHCAAHPEQHNQECWFDDYTDVWTEGVNREDGPVLTADWRQHIVACVAGWTAILNGWQPVHPDEPLVVNDAGEAANVAAVARRLLGLSYEQALSLFSRTWNLEGVRLLAEQFRQQAAA